MRLFSSLLFLLLVGQTASAADKGDASPEGLEAAQKDVAALKLALKQKAPEQVVKEFIPATGQPRLGGYEYFYKYMANMAIRDELASRGIAARGALLANTSNSTRIFEAINGPGDTVGRICGDLLAKLPK